MAVSIIGCKKDSTQTNTSTNTPTVTTGNPNLIGTWIQDSSSIVGQPPTIKDSVNHINDTISITSTSYTEKCTQNFGYQAWGYSIASWQTSSDSLFIWLPNGINWSWNFHYKYTITNNKLFIFFGTFSENGMSFQKGGYQESYWYHKL